MHRITRSDGKRMLIFILKSNHRGGGGGGGGNSHLILYWYICVAGIFQTHSVHVYRIAEMYTYSCMIYIVLLPIDVSIFMPC